LLTNAPDQRKNDEPFGCRTGRKTSGTQKTSQAAQLRYLAKYLRTTIQKKKPCRRLAYQFATPISVSHGEIFQLKNQKCCFTADIPSQKPVRE
jgi:hypothetical protein